MTTTSLCAIFWFNAAGQVINPAAAYVWPKEVAESFAAAEQQNYPDLQAKIECK